MTLTVYIKIYTGAVSNTTGVIKGLLIASTTVQTQVPSDKLSFTQMQTLTTFPVRDQFHIKTCKFRSGRM